MRQPQGTELSQNQVNTLIGLYTQRRLQEALAQGIALAKKHPNVPLIPNLLGAIYTDLERDEEAIASFKKALKIDPNDSATHYNLGVALKRFGKHEAAATSFQRALALRPDHAEAHNNLGVTLNSLGKHEAAVTSFQRALALKPNHAEVHNNLGNTLYNLGRHEMAAASFQRALILKPDDAEAHNNLGIAFKGLGRDEEAVASFQRALGLKPDYAEAHNNLGATLKDLGQNEAAIASFQKALALKPHIAEAHHNLGIVLRDSGHDAKAVVASFQKAVDLDKNYISARGELTHQLEHICDWDQIGEAAQSDLTLLEFGSKPTEVMSPFNILALIDDARFHRRVAEAYMVAHYKPNSALGPLLRRDNAGRVRIGYFSADFHDHATMYLMAELFERHDRSKFEIHAFSFGPDKKDGMRSRLVNSVEAFHDVRLKRDAEIAALSRSLGIDIAVDLKGHTAHCRASIFACRAAPIQVNYLGYPGTMGASYYDYIIADPVLIPPAYQPFYSEKVAYLPNSYQANDSNREISDKALSRSDFGLPEKAFVFCCFNNNYKITPDVFDIWMRLLGKIEGTVLWLLKVNQLAEQNLRKEALKRGVDPDRLIFAEHKPAPDHLARHRLADLFLDTFNVNAHTTASDALWAGLPILTKMGESFASRVAGSLLNAVELPELITATAQEYENTALRLATHPHELKTLKEKLRHNLTTTALFDTALFTQHIEAAFTQMFKRLNEGLEPDHFYIEN